MKVLVQNSESKPRRFNACHVIFYTVFARETAKIQCPPKLPLPLKIEHNVTQRVNGDGGQPLVANFRK